METTLSNRFFAMFDIIGFSNLVKTMGTEALFKQFSKSVIRSIQYAATNGFIEQDRVGYKVSVPDLSKLRVNYQIFSDTIIFYTKDNSWNSFFDIIVTAVKLMTFSFYSPGPFRGAIGYGDLMTNEFNVMIGTSVIDAYTGEQEQVWSGCMLTKKCEEFCEEQNYFKFYEKVFSSRIEELINEGADVDEIDTKKEWLTAVVKYDVPKQRKITKDEIDYYFENHFVINWTHWVGTAVDIGKVFIPSEISHHKKIKNNTLDFEKWARSKYKIN